jgi:hypothetical protein
LPTALVLEHYLVLAQIQTPTQPMEHELALSHPAGEEQQKRALPTVLPLLHPPGEEHWLGHWHEYWSPRERVYLPVARDGLSAHQLCFQ